MATAKKTTTPARKPKAGHGKGTRKAGGKAAATPARSSTTSRGKVRKRDRPTPVDLVNRARRIAAARSKQRPDSWPTIAKREELSERQVRRIYDDFLTWGRIETDFDELVDHSVAIIEASMLELDDVIRAASEDGNHAARVGALRLLLEAVAGRWDVLRSAGRLPRSVTAYREEQETRLIFDAMARVLRRHNIADEVIDELMREALPAGDVVEGRVAA